MKMASHEGHVHCEKCKGDMTKQAAPGGRCNCSCCGKDCKCAECYHCNKCNADCCTSCAHAPGKKAGHEHKPGEEHKHVAGEHQHATK